MSRVLGKSGTHKSSDELAQEDRRRDRYRGAEELRRFNAWLFKGERLGQCGWRRGVKPGLKRSASGRVHWTGIKTCGSVWACLLCAAKIRAARAAEIDHLAKAHLAAGGHCTMLTFTLPHYASDSLFELWEAMTRAWESMTSGQVYAERIKARYGIIGFIKAVEVTIGFHGWHPHLHVLIFHDTPLSKEDGSLEEFRALFGERWRRFISRQLDRQIHYEFGVDAVIVRDDEGIGAYVSKIHFELAQSDLKRSRNGKGRTPWQVGVDAADTGEAQDTARWKEWVEVSHSKRAISISPAVRNAYPAHETAELSDEELAQQEQEGEVELNFDDDVYDGILHYRGSPLRALVALAFEDGGKQAVLETLRVLDLPVYISRGEPGDDCERVRFVSAQAWSAVASGGRRHQRSRGQPADRSKSESSHNRGGTKS